MLVTCFVYCYKSIRFSSKLIPKIIGPLRFNERHMPGVEFVISSLGRAVFEYGNLVVLRKR